MASFVSHLYYLPMDPAKEEGYPQLRQRLVDLTGEVDPDNLLFYLATPPSLYGVVPIVPQSCRTQHPPIHVSSSRNLSVMISNRHVNWNKTYASVFNEHQIYRIDHFSW